MGMVFQVMRELAYDWLALIWYHCSLVIYLTYQLGKWLVQGTNTWIIMFGRLITFTAVLLPGWCRFLYYYIFDKRIIRNVSYGLGGKYRNLLDIYLPGLKTITEPGRAPVVVFVSGGAYIIGYKMWSALVARGLAKMGCLVIVPDYRNFPQGDLEDMLEDIRAAVAWTAENAAEYGGNPNKIVLAGQSAGAHICLSALVDAYVRTLNSSTLHLHDNMMHNSNFVNSLNTALNDLDPFKPSLSRNSSRASTPSTPSVTWKDVQTPVFGSTEAYIYDSLALLASWASSPTPASARRKKIRFSSPLKSHRETTRTELDLANIALFIGVSGPYDLCTMQNSLHARGLDSSILSWICGGNLLRYSPTRQIFAHTQSSGSFSFAKFPRTALFHGSSDATVPLSICEDLARALTSGGAHVHQRHYSGLTHTDSILESPLSGDYHLMFDMLAQIHAACDLPSQELAKMKIIAKSDTRGDSMVGPALIAVARFVNPF